MVPYIHIEVAFKADLFLNDEVISLMNAKQEFS